MNAGKVTNILLENIKEEGNSKAGFTVKQQQKKEGMG